MKKKWLLPVEAYTSQEWFDREQTLLFSKVWQFAGMQEDLPTAGNFQCLQIGPYPIIVVRGEDDQLRAFHNICRHRGTELLRTTGKSKKMIVCPYHHWVYSLDGKLKSVPNQAEFPDLDKSNMGLHSASITLWKEMIFVHPDEDAPPFEDWLDTLPDSMGPHQPDKLVQYDKGVYKYDVRANWKIFVENFIDGYHLDHLHAETLNMYAHNLQEYRFAGRHWTFFEPLEKSYLANIDKVAAMPVIDHIPKNKLGAYVHMLFPNFGIAETELDWTTINIVPIAPDRTSVEVRSRSMPMSNAQYIKGMLRWTVADSSAKCDEGDPLKSGDFMAEDIYACEQQQSAMSSPMFEVGAIAKTLESAIIEYQEHYLAMMEKD